MSAKAWAISIIAIPVLYLPSEPPLYLALSAWSESKSTAFKFSGFGDVTSTWSAPAWLKAFYAPFGCLETKPVIGNVVYGYRLWWEKHYLDIFGRR
jgi:hypothetical protein